MTPAAEIPLKLPKGVAPPRRRISVVIPSKTLDNLLPCIDRVQQHEPDARIFVIDDGIPDRSVVDAVAIDGIKPFVFARNCNIGIAAAQDDDIVILNDDALLETKNGFSLMQQTLEAYPKLGLLSAATNFAGNPEQQRRHDHGFRILTRNTPGNSFPTMAFVCVLIPRRTIKAVGMLDERFTAYGFEDNDYCRRIYNMKQQIGVHDGCFVDHSKLKSSYRGAPAAGGKLKDGRDIYMEKWGSM